MEKQLDKATMVDRGHRVAHDAAEAVRTVGDEVEVAGDGWKRQI